MKVPLEVLYLLEVQSEVLDLLDLLEVLEITYLCLLEGIEVLLGVPEMYQLYLLKVLKCIEHLPCPELKAQGITYLCLPQAPKCIEEPLDLSEVLLEVLEIICLYLLQALKCIEDPRCPELEVPQPPKCIEHLRCPELKARDLGMDLQKYHP